MTAGTFVAPKAVLFIIVIIDVCLFFSWLVFFSSSFHYSFLDFYYIIFSSIYYWQQGHSLLQRLYFSSSSSSTFVCFSLDWCSFHLPFIILSWISIISFLVPFIIDSRDIRCSKGYSHRHHQRFVFFSCKFINPLSPSRSYSSFIFHQPICLHVLLHLLLLLRLLLRHFIKKFSSSFFHHHQKP